MSHRTACSLTRVSIQVHAFVSDEVVQRVKKEDVYDRNGKRKPTDEDRNTCLELYRKVSYMRIVGDLSCLVAYVHSHGCRRAN